MLADQNKLPNWIFTIESRKFNLDHEYYAVDIGLDGDKCAVTFNEDDVTIIEWGLGNRKFEFLRITYLTHNFSAFLRKFCQHYDVDKKQLGLSSDQKGRDSKRRFGIAR